MMEERMTVREVVQLFCYGTDWQLIGGKTGKKLCTCFSREKTREKYMDKKVSAAPLKADFYVSKPTHFTEFVKPMISIWVSGE